MIRNLKAMGLAVVAVLALGAMSASAAHATAGTATVEGGGAVGYTATQIGGGHTFTLPGGRTLSCATAVFSGTVTDGSSETVATPTYETCHAVVSGSTVPATVTLNGCTYRFTLETPSGSFWNALTHLECPGAGVQIHLYLNHENHTNNINLCTYEVKPQTVSGVRFSNAANGDIQINAVEAEVTLTKTFGTIGNCGGSSSVSKYNGETLAEGDEGKAISIH